MMERWNTFADGIHHIGENGSGSDFHHAVFFRNGLKLPHRLKADENGVSFEKTRNIHAQFRAAGNEACVGIFLDGLKEVFQGVRPQENTAAGLVIEAGGILSRCFQHFPEGVFRIGGFPCREGCTTNGAVARAAAEVAAKMIVERVERFDFPPVTAFKNRSHEARCAVAALRAVAVDHGLLCGMHAIAGHAFHGDDFPAGECGEEGDTAVDRPEDALSVDVGINDNDRAGPAIALCTAFLGGGEVAAVKPIQQGCIWMQVVDFDFLAIEAKGKALEGFRGGGGVHQDLVRVASI